MYIVCLNTGILNTHIQNPAIVVQYVNISLQWVELLPSIWTDCVTFSHRPDRLLNILPNK